MLEYWMAHNETRYNGSKVAIEEVLQDPASVILFVGYPQWLLYFAAACCICFMLIGIPGNLITVAALFRTKRLKNATAVFIMNLSMSDLMFCCFNLPLATSTFWHSSWLHGPLLCRLFPLLRYGLVAVSLFTVLAITINRYVMIGHPRLYPRLYKRRYLIPMLLAIWTIAFGVLIVTWFERWGRFGLDPVIGSCSILPDTNGRSPKEFLFVLAFLTPCLAIVVCYARIFYIVRRTASKSRRKNKNIQMERAEASYEQRSTSMKDQEKESALSSIILCLPSTSSVRAVFYRQDEEESDLQIETASPGRNSFRATQSCSDRNADCVTRSNTNDPTTSNGIRFERKLSSGYDTLHASLTTTTDGVPFADDHAKSDPIEIELFLDKKQRSNEPRRKSLRNSYSRLDRMASRASFITESALWPRNVADNDDRSEVLVDSKMRFLERSSVNKKAYRRESKFKSIGRTRSNSESTSRMSAKDRKLLQMILVIFSSFLVCYLPITVTKIFKSAVEWRGLNIAGYILIYLTTCINPVIYVVMSSEYRSAYKRVLLCKNEQVSKTKSAGLPMLS